MADNVNVNANVETILKYLENNSQVKDIDISDIESIFEQLSSDNQDVSTEEFINTFNEYFMVDTTETNEEDAEEYLAALSEIAAGDGNSVTISAEDIDTLSNALEEYNSKSETGDSFNIDDLDMSEWSEIESKENKTWTGKSKGTYTYTASNGTKVTVENSEGVQILENNETGEILVIGAEGAEIKGSSKDNTITVYDSEIDSIETGKGVDNIKVYNSTADTIKTGKGTDSIYINDSTVETLNTGAGSDFVSVTNSDTTKINTSSSFLNGILDKGEDTVILNDSTAETLKTGRGDDTVIAEESSVTTLKSGWGSDSLSLAETEVETLKTNDKDTIIEDGNYLDFDTSKISEIESDVEIELSDGSTIALSDYTDYILNQEVGFETEEEYEEYVIETLTNNLETMKSVYQTQEDNDGIVSDIYNILKELSGFGISSDDVETYIEEQEAIIEGLTAAMNGESSMTFEEAYEYYTGTTYSQEKIDNYIEVSNTYSAVMVGCSYDEDYTDKFEEATGISVNDLAAEFALCQMETFGQTSELEELVNEYSEDQESFKDNISAVISTTGIICIAAGAVICVACPAAAGVGKLFMEIGKYVSLSGMFIDNGLDLVDDTSAYCIDTVEDLINEGGLTDEFCENQEKRNKDYAGDLGDIALETGVEAVSYAAGRGIGKLTNGLNDFVRNKALEAGAGKIASYVTGQAAETVADTALSLGADYAIAQGQSYITTGEFMDADDYWSLERFTGEGRNQLMGILQGLASEKVNIYQQTAITTAQTKILSGDTEGAKIDLETAGIKTTDASFDDFVEQVKAVDEGTVKASSSDMETVDVEPETVKTDSETDILESVSSSKTGTNIEETDIQTKNAAVESESTEIKSNDTETSSKKAAVDSTDEVKTAKVYSESSIKSSELSLEDISKMTTEEKTKYLQNKGLISRDAEMFSWDCTDAQYERVCELAERGVTSQYFLIDLAQIDPNTQFDDINYQKSLELLDKGVGVYDVKSLVSDDTLCQKYLELLDKGISKSFAKNIAQLDDYEKAIELIDCGITSASDIKSIISLEDGQFQLIKNFLQEFDNTEGTKIAYEKTELDNGAGTQVKTTSEWKSHFVDEETGDEYSSKIYVTQTIEPDGTVKIERTEAYEDGTSKSWYIDGDSSFDSDGIYDTYGNGELKTQTEIIYNEETGEPESVIYTKKSDSLEGVYEKTQYTLEDYPEDYDVLKGINEGTIKGGTQLSKVTVNDDGSKTYVENITSNGSNIQRTYTQGTNGTDYDYHYTITDETGTQILDTSVSFTKNSGNQTTTVINGVEYIANFDDSTHIIEITGSDGTAKTIDISKMADKNLEEIWETAKNLSSDSLETLLEIGNWVYTSDWENSVAYDDNSKIITTSNTQLITHELGHVKDNIINLSNDTELIDIYNSEIESFNSKYTNNSGQAYIRYLSQTCPMRRYEGLIEVVADTNMLLTNYGHNTTEIESRAQFLVQNFPKTMAYIADKFGLNSAGQE